MARIKKIISGLKRFKTLSLIFIAFSIIFGSLVFIEKPYTEHFWAFGIKNVTLFQYSLFLSYVFGLLGFEDKLKRLTEKSKEFLIAIFSFSGMASGYEFFNSLFMWFFSANSKDVPLDTLQLKEIIRTSPTSRDFPQVMGLTHILVNKMFFLIFSISIFTIFLISRVLKEK